MDVCEGVMSKAIKRKQAYLEVRKMNEKQLFKSIAYDYIGEITENEESVYITHKNKICNYYENGSAATKRRVCCKVGVRLIHLFNGGTHWLLEFEEETYSILGGGTQSVTEDGIIRVLQRYNFQRKSNEQTSIFDLLAE